MIDRNETFETTLAFTTGFVPLFLFVEMRMKKAIPAVMALIGVMVVAGGYHLYRSSRVKSAQPCLNRLRQIESAKDQWAAETGTPSGGPVIVENILPYLRRGMPTCHVAGATYTIGKVGEETRCTFHGTETHYNPDCY